MAKYDEVVMTNLTKDNIKKLKQGKNIRLTPQQLKGGDCYLHLDTKQMKKWRSNKKKGSGMCLCMDKEQIGSNPVLIAVAETVLPIVAEKTIDLLMNQFNKEPPKKKKTQK